MKKQFRNIANALRSERIDRGLTQEQISSLMGLGNSQMISNVERGTCSLPIKYVKRLETEFKFNKQRLVSAIIKDFEDSIYEETV